MINRLGSFKVYLRYLDSRERNHVQQWEQTMKSKAALMPRHEKRHLKWERAFVRLNLQTDSTELPLAEK